MQIWMWSHYLFTWLFSLTSTYTEPLAFNSALSFMLSKPKVKVQFRYSHKNVHKAGEIQILQGLQPNIVSSFPHTETLVTTSLCRFANLWLIKIYLWSALENLKPDVFCIIETLLGTFSWKADFFFTLFIGQHLHTKIP